jgi:3-carboxy-cis,cis-muconate cycloisomerase
MTLFDGLFYSGRMIAVFSDESRLQHMLDFEAALASVEGALGVIPPDASRIIVDQCKVDVLDVSLLREDASHAGNLAIPLVRQLTKVVALMSADAARYVHWGATSQDVIDTGCVLQMREAIGLIDNQLKRLIGTLAALAESHAETVMPGRTWLQQAVPITFGWKVACWLDALLRHQTRLDEVRSRILTLQFGGAGGTLASLGKDAPNVSKKLAEMLDLASADISWHTSRDRFGEVAATLGLIVATLGKMARDLSLMMQTEVAELSESVDDRRGGSSTMPQKRNPVGCAAVLAAAIRVPGLVATILASMAQEHERGLGNWQAEWETIPAIFNLCSGALEKMHEVAAGLEVDCGRMAANLELTHGLIFAEAVSMALAPQLGKLAAHARVERACQLAIERKQHLRTILSEDDELTNLISETELKCLFDPAQYLGSTRDSIDRVIARASASGITTQSGWIELGNVRIHYDWSGPLDKPVLVFSHSLGTDLTMWDGQIGELSEHFRILRYDTRGHGHSSAPTGPYSIEQFGGDVIALLDTHGIERCNFCGLSMGGMIGQWLGMTFPSRIRKLILCDTAAKITTADLWNARIDTVRNEGIVAILPGMMERCFTPGFRQRRPDVITKARAMAAAGDPAGYVACCAALRDADYRNVVSEINIPTLVISGTHDSVTAPEDGRFLANLIPGAEFIEVNGSHLSNMEAEREFNAAVLKFLLS